MPSKQIRLPDIVYDLSNKRILAKDVSLIRQIFSDYSLNGYLTYFLENNTVRQNQTYHNNLHTFHVVLNCLECSLLNHYTDEETKTLLIASLFHDFLHGQGQYADRRNVELAVYGLKGIEQTGISIPNLEQVVNCIISTRTPYSARKPSALEATIRDADHMTVYQDNDVYISLITGLFAEMHRYNQELTFNSFINNQIKYYTQIKWYTKYGYTKAVILDYPHIVKEKMALLKSNKSVIDNIVAIG